MCQSQGCKNLGFLRQKLLGFLKVLVHKEDREQNYDPGQENII